MEEWVRLRRGAPLEWHEAVAIVCDVAEAVAGGELSHVPAISALAVDAGGSVHLLEPTGAARERVADQSESTAALRRLLGGLLPQSGVPQDLLRLVSGEGLDAGATPADFHRRLSFFERPSRTRDLAAVASRLQDTQEQHRLDEELESLTRKARAEAQHPSSEQPAQPKSPERRSLHLAVVFGTVVTLGFLAILSMLTLGATTTDSSTSTSDAAQKQKPGFLEKVRETAKSILGATTQPAPEPPNAGKPAGASRNRPTKTRKIRKPPSASTLAPAEEPRRTVAALAQPSFSIPLPDATGWETVQVSPVPDTVYDRRDDDVTPAMLLRPHLPTVTPTDAARKGLSVLEAVISADGQVEQVRLVRTTPERRYYDSMLLAAVKAWVFQPASRQGQPVRYRVRIPLT